MDVRFVIGNLRTGRRILDLPVLSGTWDKRRNEPESMAATVDLNDEDVASLDLRNAAAPGIAFLGVLVGEKFVGAGPIWAHTYDKNTQQLTLTAKGIGSYFARRNILPPAALTVPLIDPTSGEPNPATNSSFTGWSLGTISKKIIQQSMLWAGGELPIVFEADEAGTRERNYNGSDFHKILTVLGQNAEVENGPDWEFLPRWTADLLGIEWLFRTGSEAQPRIRSTSVHMWDASVPDSYITDVQVGSDASDMTSLAWTTGGRQAGEALVEVAVSDSLVQAGYPVFESVDSSHSTVSEPETLLAYSQEALRWGSTPTEFWSFRVAADHAPLFGSYQVGDFCTVTVKSDPYIPNGDYEREIAGLAGDQNGEWITVTTAEVAHG